MTAALTERAAPAHWRGFPLAMKPPLELCARQVDRQQAAHPPATAARRTKTSSYSSRGRPAARPKRQRRRAQRRVRKRFSSAAGLLKALLGTTSREDEAQAVRGARLLGDQAHVGGLPQGTRVAAAPTAPTPTAQTAPTPVVALTNTAAGRGRGGSAATKMSPIGMAAGGGKSGSHPVVGVNFIVLTSELVCIVGSWFYLYICFLNPLAGVQATSSLEARQVVPRPDAQECALAAANC
jgi:hypothetical protein